METVSIRDYKAQMEKLRSNKDFKEEEERINKLIMVEQAELNEIKRLASLPLVTDENRVDIIVLVTKNDIDYIGQCVTGIMKAGHPYKITIYDNTLNSIAGCNTAKIWNKLIKESTCGYVMVIDSDAFPQNEDWLKQMVFALNTDPKIAVVGSVSGEKSVTTIQSVLPYAKDVEVFDGHISGYCMLFKKTIFEKLGYFDEEFYFYGQESDLIEKILEKKEYKVAFCPRAFVKHGFQGVPSTSATLEEKRGIFKKRVDAEYSQALFAEKKKKRYEEA